MKRYIRSSLNQELWTVGTTSINGGHGKELAQKLQSLLAEVPQGRYLISLGNRGHSSGYLKVDSENIRWLADGSLYKISGYWNTDDDYYVLPEQFKPSERIDYDDDVVVVYEIFDGDNKIYSGIEDYEPMKDEDWSYCKSLGLYYLIDYADHKIYVKWKVG